MNDIGEFIKEGKKVEEVYEKTAKTYRWLVRDANEDEDRYEHWDKLIYYGNKGYRVEVKGMKKLMRRNEHPQDEWIWIELKGCRSKGWLYGSKAELIAFETMFGFVMVQRVDLIRLVESVVEMDKVAKVPWMAYYSVYSREGKNDAITLISIDELRKIGYVYWHKPEESIHP